MIDNDINKIQQNIKELQDQNAIDFQQWKRLGQAIKKLDEKIKISNCNLNLLVKKIKADYESLRKIIIDENVQLQLNEKIENVIVDTNKKIDSIVTEIDSQLETITNPVISFCFDDGYSEDDLTYSIFKEFGLTCSFALVTDYSINRRSLDIYRKYNKEGFGVNSHTCKHTNLNLDNISEGTARWEIVESKRKMNNYGFYANGLVASNSIIPDKFMDYVRENYDFAFTQYWGVINSGNKGYITDKNQDLYKLGRVSLTHNTLDTIKSTIDACVENNGILFFYDHRTGYDDGISHVTEAKLREILTYVKALVDEGKVLVKNNDEAISYYFKKQLTNKTSINNRSNLALPLIDYNRTGLNYKSWFFSVHKKLEGETISSVDDDKIRINFPNGLTSGKENSMQLKIDISKKDLKDVNNQTISANFEVYSDKEVNVTMTANVRYYMEDGTTFDVTHVGDSVKLTTETQNINVTATIKDVSKQYNYALVYWRLRSNETITNEVNIYVSKPVIVFSNNANNYFNKAKSLKTYGVSKAKILNSGFTSLNQTWINYKTSEFTYDTFKSTTVNNGTIEILKDGVYYVGVMGYYKVDGVVADRRVLLRVMPNTLKMTNKTGL